MKNTQGQSRLEKTARENGNLTGNYEVEAKIVRKKTERLKALRLAKAAEAQNDLAAAKPTAANRPLIRRSE